MADIPKEAQESITRLQMIEQNMQTLLMQKQKFQAQLFELESATKELEKAPEAFKIIGNVMVGTDAKELQKDLAQRKEIIELRIQNFEKQEKTLKEQAEILQKEVLGKLKKE